MARFGYVEQYFDDNGDPLSGGKLYFYETGTTTPLTTYSDSGQTTPNANPVVLDASGRPGDIFFTSIAKVVITDSADVILDTVDPVGGNPLSATDVKTLYESNSDTNAYTDAEKTKLSGIEALADVTDITNVTSAIDGASLTAVTPTATDKVLIQDASDSNSLKTATVASVASTQDWSGFLSLANGEYIGITADFVANTGVDAYEVCSNGSFLAGRVSANSATATTANRAIGIFTESAANGAAVKVLLHGFIRNTTWSFDIGEPVWWDQSTANATSTEPVSAPRVIIGQAMDTDILYVGGPWNWAA